MDMMSECFDVIFAGGGVVVVVVKILKRGLGA